MIEFWGMKTSYPCIIGVLLVLCFPAPAKSVPCDAASAPREWQEYVDRTHGFCFRYPPTYKRVPNTVKIKNLVTFQLLDSDARLFVTFENKPFDLQRFVQNAPTGYVDPPGPIQVGKYTFYFYGPGGGGVSYPDQYFFNLRGKTLYISFDGPYVNDKTPTAETKKLESEILATFSTFRATKH